MIYEYYCTDCGNQISGNEISFDLGGLISRDDELLNDLNAPLSIGRLSKIAAQDFVELAKRHNTELSHNHKTRMTVSLREYLEILVRNKGKAEGRELAIMQEFKSINAEDIEGFLNEAVGIIYETAEGQEVEAEKIRKYVDELKNRFPLSDSAEKEIIAEEGNGEGGVQAIRALKKNPRRYEACFWIEPEFFENGNSCSLYSVRASRIGHAAFYEPIKAPNEIRGYCPICGKPVVKGAGKYPHIMVGMLGAQSAGKTSLIMSMIKELKDSYDDLGLEYAGQILCDSKYSVMRKNEKLYENGWAVEKTLAETDANTFNATYLFSDRNGLTSKLVTLIDIAGEQCYDKEKQGLNTNALKKFPLIGKCSLYILCSCIDQTAYGNADGRNEEERIRPEAVMDIATDIYELRRERARTRNEKLPPLCIVMTKDDMARDESGQQDDNNPFAGIKPVSEANYLFSSKLTDLSLTYDSCPDPNIRQPLKWAVKVFNQMQTKTYVSIMSCSALGRLAARYEGDPDNMPIYKDPVTHKAVPFTRKNITDLWKWVLVAGGIVPVMGTTYRFPHIPSFIESYGNGPGVFRINVPELKNRLAGTQRLFINASHKDINIYRALTTPVPKKLFSDPARELQRRLETICLSPDE